MTIKNKQHIYDNAPTYNSHPHRSFIDTVYLYAQPSWLGVAIWLQLIASLMYLVNDTAYSYNLHLFHTKAVNTINLSAALLFLINSVLYYIAYRISRQQHHTGHANGDLYEVCVGRIDSTLGVTAYILNVVGSLGYVVSALITIYTSGNPVSKVKGDIATHYLDMVDMSLFCVSAGILLYIWILDEVTCSAAKPIDQTIVSNVCDVAGSALYLGIVLYGLISRLLVQQHTPYDTKQHAYDYQGQTRSIGTREHRLYVFGDLVYLVSPVVLLLDYYRRKRDVIQQQHKKLLSTNSGESDDAVETSKLLALESHTTTYGTQVDAVALQHTSSDNNTQRRNGHQ